MVKKRNLGDNHVYFPFKYFEEFNMLLCSHRINPCLLYTSDAADDMQCVDLGGRRIIKKKIFFKQKTAYEM